ncbi:MAG: pseudouridine synthase [Rhizobiaceae bacterium]|nr:pseudouridine synthase [Rhizobiaceae bacterium]
MSDDRKKPSGGKGGRQSDGDKRSGPRPGGKSYAAAKGGPKSRSEGGGKRPDKPGFAKRDGADRPPRKEWTPRDRDAAPRTRAEGEEGAVRFREDRKPRFEGGGKRPDKPGFAKRDGGDRPPRKEWTPRDRDAAPRARAEGEEGAARFREDRKQRFEGGGKRPDKPGFAKRDGADRPPRKEWTPRDRDATPRARTDSEDGAPRFRAERKPRFDADKPRTERRPDGASRGPARVRPQVDEVAEAGERIAKRLARVGIASRRDAEELIAAGRVRVNGQVLTSPAFNVHPDDRIELDGTEIPPIERTRLFLFNKPGGVVTTSRDPEGRRTVFDVLPEGLPRLITVGRLDINTEGLLLLTNDGGLARVLELPATGWLRRYRVRVHGKVEQATLDGLKDGIAVDGIFYGAIEASLDREQGSNAWLTLGLREGKNREVKNVLGALGLEVSRLIRISFGPFQLGELPEGQILEVKGRTLRDQLGERLIEESGANFEADIAKPFSNKLARSGQAQPSASEAPRRPRERLGEPGEGGLIKKRRFDKQDQRQQALGRLSTKPDGKPRGRKGEREEKAPEPKRPRSANVWMAPGARPQGKARPAAAESARGDESRPSRSRPAGGAKSSAPSGEGRPARPPFKGDRPDRPAGPGKPRPKGGRGDADRRR